MVHFYFPIQPPEPKEIELLVSQKLTELHLFLCVLSQWTLPDINIAALRTATADSKNSK